MIKHFLLIDDDEDEHLFFQWSLESISAELCLSKAYGTEQAMRFLKQARPDFIFLDIRLALENGLDCLEKVKQDPALSEIQVYMYSTEITETTFLQAIALGASGCLKKTRNHKLLSKKILEILDARPLYYY